jgi:ribosome biogenesis protein ERB1
MRHHTAGLRGAAFHARYPLFASAADDGAVHVFHGRCVFLESERGLRGVLRLFFALPKIPPNQNTHRPNTPTKNNNPKQKPTTKTNSVYSDLMTNPLLVPVKVLRGHSVVAAAGVLGVAFHPAQPWVFTAGADGDALLWCN